MVRRRGTLSDQYKPYLSNLMAYTNGRVYLLSYEFSQAELLSITADQVARWFRFKAYGTPTPGPDDNPTGCRSSLLEQAKKSVSFFMPNRNTNWNVETNSGNPTKSVPVNDVIRALKLAEVRRLGLPSNAKRDLKRPEYRLTVRFVEAHRNARVRLMVHVIMKLQFHIIGRADDLTNLETRDFRSHSVFPAFALHMKVT